MKNDLQKTALLVMDVQPGIVDRLSNRDEYVAQLTQLVEAARASSMPIIQIVVGFRPGYPEISDHNKTFRNLLNSIPDYLVNPRPVLPSADGDIIVVKRRISAFSGSDLEVILRGKGIQHLVLTGISTSGVVLSTVREAADKDYELTVLSDLCADQDSEVHQILTTKVFPRQAEVMTSEQWLAAVRGHREQVQ